MRILKLEDQESKAESIFPMRFAEIEIEELASSDNGGAHDEGDEGAPAQPQIDVEELKRQAEAIIHEATEQAAGMRRAAEQEAQQAKAQLTAEFEQLRAKAVQDADASKKEGFSSGYSSGEESGFKKGYEDGFTRGKQAGLDETTSSVKMMLEVIEQLKAYHLQVLSEAQKDIVKMALSVAEKVLHKEIMTDPGTVMSVVKNALTKVNFKKNFIVHVNPLDLEVLRSASEEVASVLQSHESLAFKPSTQVEPGGCVVETESGMVDARIDRQFEEIKETVMKSIEEE